MCLRVITVEVIYKETTSKTELRGINYAVLCRGMFDVMDFYREPVYLCTSVNVYKYVRIISMAHGVCPLLHVRGC